MNSTVVRTVTRAVVASAITVAATLGLASSASAAPTSHLEDVACIDHQVYEVWVDTSYHFVPKHQSC